MSVLRGFAGYLHTLDPTVPVPPADLFPSGSHRAVPYLYSDDELAALVAATDTLRYPLQRATYRTLIGLLAVTGLRVGEAIGLDDTDVDVEHGVLAVHRQVRQPRLVPLHPSTVAALAAYRAAAGGASTPGHPGVVRVHPGHPAELRQRQRDVRHAGPPRRAGAPVGVLPSPPARSSAQFRGRHPARLVPRRRRRRGPTATAVDLPRARRPANTYWYLHAAPELLAEAAQRLDRHLASTHTGRPAMTALAPTLQAFFTDRLIRQRQASPHTITAYRNTLRLLLVFTAHRTGKPARRSTSPTSTRR